MKKLSFILISILMLSGCVVTLDNPYYDEYIYYPDWPSGYCPHKITVEKYCGPYGCEYVETHGDPKPIDSYPYGCPHL